MKTKEELKALKEEVETVSRKLHELSEEELAQVTGGSSRDHRLDLIEGLRQTLAEERDPVEQPEQPTGGYTSGVKVDAEYEYLQWLQD